MRLFGTPGGTLNRARSTYGFAPPFDLPWVPFVPPAPPAPAPEPVPLPARPPLTGPAVVDEDTLEAVRALWAVAGDVTPAVVIDDDTLRAVRALWEADDVQLPQLFTDLPKSGRLKGGTPMPYAVIACELEGRELAGVKHGAPRVWLDRRKVKITVYGKKPDALQGAQLVLAVFNLNTQLVYPSGERFIKWWPSNQVHLEQDSTVKAGDDVWKATVEAVVTSVRSV
jgi:hypothetical protein